MLSETKRERLADRQRESADNDRIGSLQGKQELTCLIAVHIPAETRQIPSLLTPGLKQYEFKANKHSDIQPPKHCVGAAAFLILIFIMNIVLFIKIR